MGWDGMGWYNHHGRGIKVRYPLTRIAPIYREYTENTGRLGLAGPRAK